MPDERERQGSVFGTHDSKAVRNGRVIIYGRVMAVPTAYLMTTKNTAKIFEAIQRAGVPDPAFTHDFLKKQLGFGSSGDRPIIAVLKAIGFLDPSGRPTDLYRQYKDPTLAKAVLAQGIRDGYSDVFVADTEAHKKSSTDLKGLFARLSEKGDAVAKKMAMTFRALVDLADFDSEPAQSPHMEAVDQSMSATDSSQAVEVSPGSNSRQNSLSLRHDIHVHLPLSSDVAVYDAIFKSLKANLL